jgi:HK97 family phage portal protein
MYQLALNENSGNPSAIIKYTDGALSEKERTLLENSWNKTLKGLANTGKVKVIGNNFDVVKMGLSPKELDFMISRRITKESIMAAFGVPLPLVDAKDTNRASFDTSIYQYQKWTITPKIRQIVDDLNAKIISMYNEPRIYLTYEDPVEDNHRAMIDDTIKLYDTGLITLEEARSVINK